MKDFNPQSPNWNGHRKFETLEEALAYVVDTELGTQSFVDKVLNRPKEIGKIIDTFQPQDDGTWVI